MSTKHPLSGEAGELVIQLMQANSNSLNYTMNALIEGYKHSSETYCATLDAVRDHVETLLSGPYMPTAEALRAALWPSEAAIRKYMPRDAS